MSTELLAENGINFNGNAIKERQLLASIKEARTSIANGMRLLAKSSVGLFQVYGDMLADTLEDDARKPIIEKDTALRYLLGIHGLSEKTCTQLIACLRDQEEWFDLNIPNAAREAEATMKRRYDQSRDALARATY